MVSANAYPVMGGVETHIYEVAPRLARMGFQVAILTTDRSGSLPKRDRLDDVPIRRERAWPAERDYYVAPGILRWIIRGNWDLLHCQGYHTLVPPLAMLGALASGTPYVVSFHSGGHASRLRMRIRSTQHQLLRPLLARAQRLVAVSRFETTFFSSHLRLPEEHFVTIPNGTEMPLPDGQLPAEEPGLILSVGRLEQYKGHHRLIAALPQVVERQPAARLRIVGAGPYEAELRRLAAASPVAERIEIGSISPLDRGGMAVLMGSASLVALLSEYEAHPVAVAEALALGRRVLLADTSGLSEIAEQGLARAIPFDSTDEEVARAVLECLRSPSPAIPRLPTWDQCAERLAALYREVLER